MLKQRSILLTAGIAIAIAVVSMSLAPGLPDRSKAVSLVAAFYQHEIQKFDSALKVYPKYFPDSSYKIRREKYCALVRQYKQVEALFTYFHPKLAQETFLMLPQF